MYLSDREKYTWHLFVDGASRNNPGLAGAGIYLLKNSIPIYKDGFFLGIKTNNQAEYLAILLGIFFLKKRIQLHDTVRVVSDSELVVRQLNGKYKVKQPHLKPLYAFALYGLRRMNAVLIHVIRKENSYADKMANRGIDEKKNVPQDFSVLLKSHGIEL